MIKKMVKNFRIENLNIPFIIFIIIFNITILVSTIISEFEFERYFLIMIINPKFEFYSLIVAFILVLVMFFINKKKVYKIIYIVLIVVNIFTYPIMQFILLLQFDDAYSEKYFISKNETIYAAGWFSGISENTKSLPIHIRYQKKIFPGVYCEKTIFKIASEGQRLINLEFPKIKLDDYYEKVKDLDRGICGEKLPYELEYSNVTGFDFSSNPTCTK